MQTKSWALAAAFALALSGASAEGTRPRIYYPRQVRRQFENNTSTETEPTSTKGGLLDGILDPILGGGESTTPPAEATNDPADEETGDSESGILIGPTGIIQLPGLIGDDTTTTKSTAVNTRSGSATATDDEITTEPTSTKPGLLDPLPTLISDIIGPDPSATKTSASTSADAPEEPSTEPTKAPTTTKPGLLDPLPTLISDILGPSEPVSQPDPPANQTEPVTQPEPTTSKPGLLDPVPTLISDILGPEPTTAPDPSDNVTEPSSTKENIITEILPSITLFPPEPTTTSPVVPSEEPTNPDDPSQTTSSPPLIPTDIIPSISLPLPGDDSSTLEPGPTDGPGNGTNTDVVPGPTTTSGSIPTDLPTGVPSDTIEPPPGANITSGLPTDTVTPPSTPPSSLPTDLPTSVENPPVSTPTAPSSIQNPVTPSSSAEEVPTVAPTPTTTAEEPTKPPVTSIVPTVTYSNTEDWLPTTIVADPTSFVYTRPTDNPTGATSTALPSDIPYIILPKNPDKPIPEGSVEIDIGFKFPLNYNHVAKNTKAAAQIFKYLPMALSNAGNFKLDKVHVSMLVPYDTRDKWGFVTTLAKVYYPEALLETLKMDLWEPNSDIYNHPNALVNDLTADIEPRIDIFGNITNDDDEENNDKPGNNDNNNDAIDSGDNGDSSAKQQATTAGIAVGAFGLAALYGGAMFIVARRYKRKRQGHRRTSSVTGSETSSDMQYARNGSPAMMGGALMSQDMSHYGAAGGRERDSHGSGPSARTANISAPVATENSLGWN